jgi:hypothetical protein
MEFKHGSIDSLQRIFVFDCLGKTSSHQNPWYEADETTYYILEEDGSIRKQNVGGTIKMKLMDPSVFGIVAMANKLLKFIIDDYISEGLVKPMKKHNINMIQDNIVCNSSLRKEIKHPSTKDSRRSFGVDDLDENFIMVLPDPECFGCLAYVSSDLTTRDRNATERLYSLFGSRGIRDDNLVRVFRIE